MTSALALCLLVASVELDGWVYFVAEPDGSTWRVSPDGGAPERVLEGRSFPYEASPDGRWISAVVDDDVVVARPDGSKARRLAHHEKRDWYPRFSPDGRRVLFESSRASFRDLFVVGSEGRLERVTNEPNGAFDGVWSPKGDEIAFVSSRRGQLDLYVIGAEGRGRRQLTRHSGDAMKPAWSPAGDAIAYLSDRDGRDDVYVVSPSGGHPAKLTGALGGLAVTRFDWHPAGREILVSMRTGAGEGRLAVVDLEGGARWLSPPGARDSEAVWSPDGRYLAFTRGGERSDIFVMKATGGPARRLTQLEGAAWCPRWLAVRSHPEGARRRAQQASLRP